MGYMTVVMVLNDAMDQLEGNKEQVIENIITASHMREGITSRAIGNYANPMQVASSQHADTPQLVLAYENDLTRFGYLNDLEDERHLEYRKSRLKTAERILKTEKELIKEMEKRIEEEKKYEKIQFLEGTIDDAVEILQKYKENKEKVYIDFNGHKLFSDKVTLDDAYRKITGKSKKAFELYEKNKEQM